VLVSRIFVGRRKIELRTDSLLALIPLALGV
jgi:hypothetical protein